MKTTIAEQKDALVGLRKELAQQQRTVAAEKNVVAKAEKKLESLESENQKLQTRIKSDDQRHRELVTESKKIIEAKRNLEKDLAASQKSSAAQAQSDKELKALRKDRKQSMAGLTQAIKRLELFEKKCHILKSEKEELATRLKKLNSKLKDAKKSDHKGSKQLAKLEQAKAKAEATATKRKSQLKSLKAEMASRIKEKNAIIGELKKKKAAKPKAKTKTKTKAKAKTSRTTVRSSAKSSLASKSKPKAKAKTKAKTQPKAKAKTKPKKSKSKSVVTAKRKPVASKPKTRRPAATATKKPDNLTRIEGIGPKIQQVMRGANVGSFAKMAKSSPKKLEKILDAVGLQMHSPATWPQQAELAAGGHWKQLDRLQDRLDGGRRAKSKSKAGKAKSATAKSSAKLSAKSASTKSTQPSPDDLTRIEGIGPKIKQLLNKADIHSFADLATASPASLDQILEAAGTRFNAAVPDSWPTQSKLAADGKWAELDKLQDELSGGR